MQCPHGAACIHCRLERLDSFLAETANGGSAAPLGLLSFQKAAEVLDASWDTVAELVSAGQLDVVGGIGRGRKVTVASIEALIARRVEEEHAPRRRTA